MKIGNCIIQKRQILEFDEFTFSARYRRKSIYITTNIENEITKAVGGYTPVESGLKRYSIQVVDDRNIKYYQINSEHDFDNILRAIEYTLNKLGF